ncbi:MAG: DUF4097 family beta strand repeat protein [Deltaproteobacteria bacterium]|nr:DUF4097 family beta strand repeat protein [Deltaproteobacteria bacterium]
MPAFPAPASISVVVDLPAGSLHVVATERDDAVATVLPATPDKASDVRVAEETRVEFADGVLTVTGPRPLRQVVLGPKGWTTVMIEVPAGSSLSGKAGTALIEGRLGVVGLTSSVGDARIEDTERLELKVNAGSAVLGRVAGPARIQVSAGSVRAREIASEATIRAANGSTTIGAVTGSLTITGAHGEIVVGRVRGTLTARSAYGNIRVDAVESGLVELTTHYGSVEVGVPAGTSAHLDVSSQHGAVRNMLDPSGGPLDGQPTAEIHVQSGFGDVIVRRPEAFSVGA